MLDLEELRKIEKLDISSVPHLVAEKFSLVPMHSSLLATLKAVKMVWFGRMFLPQKLSGDGFLVSFSCSSRGPRSLTNVSVHTEARLATST